MSRLIFAPQYPAGLRYQEWFFKDFPDELRLLGFEDLVVLGYCEDSSADVRYEKTEFAPLNVAIDFEFRQIKQFMNMRLYDNDIMLFMDLSYPGFFPQVLHHRRPSKVFSFCHATSLNNYDYFGGQYRQQKFITESAVAQMCDNVFVGSHYHKRKIGWPNAIVTYLPYPKFDFNFQKRTHGMRNNDMVSVARPSIQKSDFEKESLIEKYFKREIIRPERAESWRGYYSFLNDSKVMVITSKEETFGYQVVDAVLNDCIPIAPNRFSYPELLPKQYLYEPDDNQDMLDHINSALYGNMVVPNLLCDRDMKNFFWNITQIMKG